MIFRLWPACLNINSTIFLPKTLSNSTIELIKKDFIDSEKYHLKLETDLEDADPEKSGRLKIALYEIEDASKGHLLQSSYLST